MDPINDTLRGGNNPLQCSIILPRWYLLVLYIQMQRIENIWSLPCASNGNPFSLSSPQSYHFIPLTVVVPLSHSQKQMCFDLLDLRVLPR